MNNLESFQNFANFMAATRVQSGSGSSETLQPVDQFLDQSATDPELTSAKYDYGSISIISGSFTVVSNVTAADLETESAAKNISAFDVLDEIRSPRGELRGLIKKLRKTFALTYKDRLAHRIDSLVEALEDEGESWQAQSADSLRKMLLFLESDTGLSQPVVTVTPALTFRAQWTRGDNRHFAVDFLPDGQVRYVVFAPDPLHPDRTQRTSGVSSWENLLEVVAPLRVSRWTRNGRH